MGNISVDYDVLNQKGSPAWYSDVYANIPAPGYKGRMFISTDTYAFYRDNGTGWDLVGGPGTGTITGSGASGQVTYFNGSDTIGGSNNLFWDITNARLGINTNTPGVALDLHATTGVIAQFENTTTNNTLLSFRNQGAGFWSIGNNYSGGINDFIIYDAVSFLNRLTIKNTGVTTLIGTFTATSLIKSGGTSSQILLADGSTTPTSSFGTGSVTNVSALTIGTTGTDLSSSVANSTTTPVITLNVPTASATNRGALSSTDWTTFNNKQATITLTTTGTSGAATLIGATLNIPNYTNVGTVTNVSALTLGTTGTDLSSSVANSTTTPVITLNVPTASATNRGALSSTDWTTFNNKQATISVTSPVVLTGATISMPVASTGVSGYLSSTDWNTFNNKSNTNGTVTSVAALTLGTTGVDLSSSVATGTTTPVITLNVPTASASNRGALSSTDWTTFNGKVGGSGTTGTIPKFVSTTGLGNSLLSESGTAMTIGGSLNINASSGTGLNVAGNTIVRGDTGVGTPRQLLINAGGGTPVYLEAKGYGANYVTDFGIKVSDNAGTQYTSLYATGGNGYVGINAVSPGQQLEVNGYSKLWDGTQGLLIGKFSAGAGYGAIYSTGVTPSTTNYSLASNGASSILNGTNDVGLLINNTIGLTISSTGASNFTNSVTASSIGTGTPAFYAKADSGSNNGTYGFGNNTNYRIRAGGDYGAMIFDTAGSERIRIHSDGNVSIGNPTNTGDLLYLAGNFKMTTNSKIDSNGGTLSLQSSTGGNLLVGTTTDYGYKLATYGEISSVTPSGTKPILSVFQIGWNKWNFAMPANSVNLQIEESGTNRISIASGGIFNATSRGNFLNSTDNSLFSLNSGGTLYTVGFSPNATANSSNTLTITTGQTSWYYTGSGTATWTLPNPSGTNQMFWIKNAGTGIITLNAYSGTNIINNAGASVGSITIAIGATALIQQDGNVKSYQLQ